MVRVISEKLFSPPRSRHSSGETVDKELAARAVEALSSLNSRRLEFASDYESSSDSHWDSEVDVEGDGSETGGACEGIAHGQECSGGTDVVQKRKERRRERNKLSAQAYRNRRREQSLKQQTVLRELQDKNSRLKEQVHTLEDQISKFRRTAIRHPQSTNTSTSTSTSTSTTISAITSAETAPPTTEERSPRLHSSEGFLSFRQLSREGSPRPHFPVDNDLSHRRLVSPVVDNFSFSQPSPLPSPNTMLSSSSSLFSFPVSPSPHTVGSHRVGSLFLPAPPIVSPSVCTSISETPEVPELGVQPHVQQHFQPPPPPHIDLNANAEERLTNINSISTNTLGLCQSSDNANNNNNGNIFLAVPPLGGARPKTKAYGAMRSPEVFKVSKA